MIPSEGTYLVWLDCSQLPYRGMALEHFMINEADVYKRQVMLLRRNALHISRARLRRPWGI